MILLPHVIVIPTIHFDNQSGGQAYKVNYVVCNDELPPKGFPKLALLQEHPQGAFCFCRLVPHPLGMFLKNRIKGRVRVAKAGFMSVELSHSLRLSGFAALPQRGSGEGADQA